MASFFTSVLDAIKVGLDSIVSFVQNIVYFFRNLKDLLSMLNGSWTSYIPDVFIVLFGIAGGFILMKIIKDII